MKYIISTIKFFTILGLTTIILLGCVREQPKPVVKETQPSDPNYYIGPGGMAIDLREVDNRNKRAGCFSLLQHLSGDDAKIRHKEKCNKIGK